MASQPQRSFIGVGIALGMAIGAGVGVALGNLGVGIGVGLALGVAIGGALDAREKAKGEKTNRDGDGGAAMVVGDSDHGSDGGDGGAD